MECSPCNAQEYSANEGQTFCTKCRIDWAVTADLTDCQPCEPGSYVENPSAENWPHWHNGNPKVCAKCPAGTWTGSGKYLCQECLPGTTVNPTQQDVFLQSQRLLLPVLSQGLRRRHLSLQHLSTGLPYKPQ
jgi:hypothetical protein